MITFRTKYNSGIPRFLSGIVRVQIEGVMPIHDNVTPKQKQVRIQFCLN